MDVKYLWYLPEEALNAEYRKLCKLHHPDIAGENGDTFAELTDTYERIKGYRKLPIDIDLSISMSEIYHGCIKDIVVPDPVDNLNKQILALKVPRGVMDGTILSLTTKELRKVHVTIKEVNDTKFFRDGYNLIVHLDLTIDQVLRGDSMVMGHFNNVVNIPTKIPHSNYRHIIIGLGMPINNSDTTIKYGDLYIVYNVVFNHEKDLKIGY